MKRFAFGITLTAFLLAGTATGAAFADDSNYAVSPGQGDTTVKTPDPKDNGYTQDDKNDANNKQDHSDTGSDISTKDLYDHSKQGGSGDFDVNQTQQH